MTPLRQQMIEAMRQRGFSNRTHTSYLAAVTDLTRFYHQSPDRIDTAELQRYFNHLAQERELSAATCRLYLNAVRFFYLQVLKRSSFDVPLIVPKKPQRIPELLTCSEVGRILNACANMKHRMLLELCYGCGLRVSEVVAVRVRHIDGERRLLRIEQAKGAKDRLVIIAPSLLAKLRRYWSRYRPADWLFPNVNDPEHHLTISSAQKIFGHTKALSGVDKIGGIHSLRHAYATHQLEQGLPIHQLQQLMGHGDLHSTMRYLHWVPTQQREGRTHADLLAEVGHE
jgi:site-specific recombinase XerD